MNPIYINIAIFVGCYGVAFAHHLVVYRKSNAGGHAKAGILAGLVNPATMDAIRDFSIHIVIYSGYIIPRH